MTHKERMKILQKWEEQIFAVDNILKKIEEFFGSCVDSDFSNIVNGLAEEYTYAVAKLIGDEGDSLTWYHDENDMGKKELAAKAANWKKARKIVNLEVLCKLIESDI